MEKSFVKTLFISTNFMVAVLILIKFFGYNFLLLYGFPILAILLYAVLKKEFS